jgi:hypothetical protein
LSHQSRTQSARADGNYIVLPIMERVPNLTRRDGRTGFFPESERTGPPVGGRPLSTVPVTPADPVGRPSSSTPDSDKHKFLCLPCTACTRSPINRAPETRVLASLFHPPRSTIPQDHTWVPPGTSRRCAAAARRVARRSAELRPALVPRPPGPFAGQVLLHARASTLCRSSPASVRSVPGCSRSGGRSVERPSRSP